jgi:hypothetical protein
MICVTITDLEAQVFALLEEIERQRAALLEVGHYVAMCPPPDGVTDKLKNELLEQRKRVEQAAASVA